MAGREIDWHKLRQRMAAVNAAMERGWTRSPGEKIRILKERAERLAHSEPQRDPGESIEVVEFRLAREHYAIESGYIREVYPLREYTPLPGVPPFVLGLLNVRGRIISVVDIKKFFDMEEKGISELNKVIIIGDQTMEFGILADAIIGVRNIAAGDLEQPLTTLTGIHLKFVRGVNQDRLVVLDALSILTDPDIVVHEEV